MPFDDVTRLCIACCNIDIARTLRTVRRQHPALSDCFKTTIFYILNDPARLRLMSRIPISDTRRDDVWAKANPDGYAQFIAMASADPYADEPGHATGAWRQLEARATHDAWERLSDIRNPTFIAAGRHDGIAKPETQERMAARIPGARLQFFDGGHIFVIQDRAAFPAIVDFLDQA